MKKTSLFVFIVCVFLTGCSRYIYYRTDDGKTYTKTVAEDIKIYSNDIENEYFIIGPVAALATGDGDKTLEHLKEESAELGADAIIFLELNKIGTGQRLTGLSGVAVKFK